MRWAFLCGSVLSINVRGTCYYTTDGRELVLGSIALAEERRTEAEHAATIVTHLSGMQLQAVMKNAATEVISAILSVEEKPPNVAPVRRTPMQLVELAAPSILSLPSSRHFQGR